MVNLETYYLFANIRADNNSLKWSGDGGKTWTALHIPTGCYELKAINSEIIRMRGGNSEITILPNVNTLQCILNVVGAKWKLVCSASTEAPMLLVVMQASNLLISFSCIATLYILHTCVVYKLRLSTLSSGEESRFNSGPV